MSRVQKNVVVQEMQLRNLARAVSAEQKIIRVQPQTSTSVASGSTATTRIELPAQDYLLPTTSHLQFELAFNATTNNFKRSGVAGIVRNVRVYVGDQLADLHQNKNLFELFLIDAGASAEAYTNGWDSGLRGDTINGASPSGTQHYALRISTGLLSYAGLLPLWAMPRIAIEIDWTPANECLYDNAGATPSYTISNLYFCADTFVLEPSYTESIMSRLQSGMPIDFQYTSYRLAGPVGLSSGANPTGSYKINNQARSAKFLVMGIRDNNNAAFNQDICIDNECNLTSYQLKIGNNILPNQPLLHGAQSRVEIKECLNQVGMYNELGNISRSQFLSTTSYTSSTAVTTGSPTCANKSWFAINLEKFMTQQVQSGEDFLARDVVLDLNAGSSVATAKSLFVFVVYDAVLSLNSLYNATVSF
jgi:hypothetical protein